MDKKDLKGGVATTITVFFFLTFTMTRIIFAPFLLYNLGKIVSFTWSSFNWFDNSLTVFLFTEYLLIWFLNLYWYYLILRTILKIFGCIPDRKKPKKDAIEEKLLEKEETTA